MARLMCEHRQSRNGKGYIMRKKMYARALAIVLAISMVGCGSNNTNIPSFTTSESLQAETGSVEIETSSTSEVTIIDEVTENEADVISTENPEDEEENDEEKATVMKNRNRAFDYMVDMTQEYNLDGLKTLNEDSIKRFAEICAIENAYDYLWQNQVPIYWRHRR